MEDATDTTKYFGRVYTPGWIVEQLLAPVFAGSLRNVRICDPACGTGDFLVPLASEVCQRASRASPYQKKRYLSTLQNLTGYDVDTRAVSECRKRLSLVAEKYLGDTFPASSWRILEGDALSLWEQDEGICDYVVGNPPYVRIQHLEKHRREQVKQGGWAYFRGASDLYIVFFELGLRLLKQQGELHYISPSGWLRNDAGLLMRQDLAQHHGIVSLHDFRDHQVFPGYSTYTCLTRIAKGKKDIVPRVYQWGEAGFEEAGMLACSSPQWAVCARDAAQEISAPRLSDIADIHVGIQTLADRVFILEAVMWKQKEIIVKAAGREFVIERSAVRKILKASVMKDGKDRVNRVVIYPYDKAGKLLPESSLAQRFPKAYQWLLEHKEKLLQRDKGATDPSKWYGYGRGVGIRTGFGQKILTSGMNPSPNFQMCKDPDTLFYSGYCIKPRDGHCMEMLVAALNSPEMEEHIRTYAQPFQGGWFSYAKRYIQNFPLPSQKYTLEQ